MDPLSSEPVDGAAVLPSITAALAWVHACAALQRRLTSCLAQTVLLTLACKCALQEVDLSRTRMGPDACVVLAEALRINTVVERILLHGNPLGESGGWHLMSAITHNRCLEYIGLQGANFRPSGEAPGEQVAAVQRFIGDYDDR